MGSNNTEEEGSWGLNLKEGERVLAPTRRPDGTLRKPIKIRAGYVPQEEVAIYQSKAALLRRNAPTGPPGYDDDESSNKQKTKSAKRNERRKEKRQQHQQGPSSSSEKGKSIESITKNGDALASENGLDRSHDVEDVANQMSSLGLSANSSDIPAQEQKVSDKVDVDKRIRALKKKIRLAESQQSTDATRESLNADQREKLAKIDNWKKELQELEEKKANT